MIRYIVLTILITATLGHAYRPVSKERRHKQRISPIVAFDENSYPDYDYSIYAKETNPEIKLRPWTISYWGNLLKKTRLPNLNLPNPFSKLFNPYVIKVDFPPDTEPSQKPDQNANRKKKPQQDYIYLNPVENEEDNSNYLYDPVTQQYYEVVEGVSQDYNPENNYFATTFKDDDEVVINLDDEQGEQVVIETDEKEFSTEETSQSKSSGSSHYILRVYN